MSVQLQEQGLRDALTCLETSIDTPVLSGDLSDWVQSVRKAFDAVVGALRAQFQNGHHQQFASIIEQDLELARRVEQLKEEDQAILAQMTALGHELDRLATITAVVGRDEARAQDFENRVEADGLAFIARVRKQETAITAWLLEAYQRDQGTVD